MAWENLWAAAHGEGAVKGALAFFTDTYTQLKDSLEPEPEGKNDQMSSKTRRINRVACSHARMSLSCRADERSWRR